MGYEYHHKYDSYVIDNARQFAVDQQGDVTM